MAVRLSWTHPCCERCWIAQYSSALPNGNIEIRTPTQLADPHVERCAYCGQPTIFGVYVRADPATVLFPAEKED